MGTEARHPTPPERDWQTVMQEGDEETFHHLVTPLTDTLRRAAQRDLDFYVQQGRLHEDDLTPEEVTGEALIQAWQQRERCPKKMSLKGWLLGIQHRVLRGLVDQYAAYREDKAISLDEPVTLNPDAYDAQEWFWDWYEPEESLTWEDVTPGQRPVDLSPTLSARGGPHDLEIENYHVLMMHDEFEMGLPEVAYAMNRQVREVAELLEQARASLRERGTGASDMSTFDQPAPPEGSDE